MAMLGDARVEATVPALDLDRARRFYEERLGLTPAGSRNPGHDLVFDCGGDTRLFVYERPLTAGTGQTLAHFVVDDVGATVAKLRGRGVEFEDYDLPELKTVDGVATMGDSQFAWFKDVDGNVIGIHD
jgi:catechol 2,3-dioxygenase-like lactoylglutathione lyase family enzyme